MEQLLEKHVLNKWKKEEQQFKGRENSESNIFLKISFILTGGRFIIAF